MAEWIDDPTENAEQFRIAQLLWDYARELGPEYQSLCLPLLNGRPVEDQMQPPPVVASD